MAEHSGNFGIIVSGGPAPGINSVIASAVIEANNSGYQVWGFKHGFKGASSGNKEEAVLLTTEGVSRIAPTGGSILGTSRCNPFASPHSKEAFSRILRELDIDKLIVIGGEGSAYISYLITMNLPEISVVHVPKTIDNDLVLPNNHASFGFETAREIGMELVSTLMVDAKTTDRWYLVEAMGRQAGFLALGIGLAAGATCTIIPEEFSGESVVPEDIAKIIVGSISARLQRKKRYGVVICAEGLLDRLDPVRTEEIKDWPRDELGRITYSEIELGEILVPHVHRLCAEKGIEVSLKTKNLGYELRCANPIAFDIEYTKFLGHGAVRHILAGHRNIMVTKNHDELGYQLIHRMVADGRVVSRYVNLLSDYYKVARSFMIR